MGVIRRGGLGAWGTVPGSEVSELQWNFKPQTRPPCCIPHVRQAPKLALSSNVYHLVKLAFALFHHVVTSRAFWLLLKILIFIEVSNDPTSPSSRSSKESREVMKRMQAERTKNKWIAESQMKEVLLPNGWGHAQERIRRLRYCPRW